MAQSICTNHSMLTMNFLVAVITPTVRFSCLDGCSTDSIWISSQSKIKAWGYA
ncbi:MAG: hypothetical protein JJP05_05745 [cyanobacterium endosymbiont of Rhopalodia gibba]